MVNQLCLNEHGIYLIVVGFEPEFLEHEASSTAMLTIRVRVAIVHNKRLASSVITRITYGNEISKIVCREV